MANIAICDDDAAVAQVLARLIGSSTTIKDKEIQISIFNKSEQMLDSVIQGNEYHMVYMDIDLGAGGDNGLDLSRQIKAKYPNTLMIFMSSYDKYFAHMVQFEPFRFLTKPFNPVVVDNVLADAFRRINYNGVCYYAISVNGTKISVDLGDVMYIYSDLKTCVIVDRYGNNYKFYKKLDVVTDEIKTVYPYFVRMSKSYLVNYLHVTKFGPDEATLINGEKFTVSHSFQQSFKREIKDIMRRNF